MNEFACFRVDRSEGIQDMVNLKEQVEAGTARGCRENTTVLNADVIIPLQRAPVIITISNPSKIFLNVSP